MWNGDVFVPGKWNRPFSYMKIKLPLYSQTITLFAFNMLQCSVAGKKL